MSEHYKQSQIGTWDWKWCNQCGRNTRHEVVRATATAGKLGHCLEHSAPQLTKEQARRRAAEARRQKQPSLF
jgi:hypothetical protein